MFLRIKGTEKKSGLMRKAKMVFEKHVSEQGWKKN